MCIYIYIYIYMCIPDVLVHKDVGGLEVPVDDAGRVQVLGGPPPIRLYTNRWTPLLREPPYPGSGS